MECLSADMMLMQHTFDLGHDYGHDPSKEPSHPPGLVEKKNFRGSTFDFVRL